MSRAGTINIHYDTSVVNPINSLKEGKELTFEHAPQLLFADALTIQSLQLFHSRVFGLQPSAFIMVPLFDFLAGRSVLHNYSYA